jgi:hypothetical protein
MYSQNSAAFAFVFADIFADSLSGLPERAFEPMQGLTVASGVAVRILQTPGTNPWFLAVCGPAFSVIGENSTY